MVVWLLITLGKQYFLVNLADFTGLSESFSKCSDNKSADLKNQDAKELEFVEWIVKNLYIYKSRYSIYIQIRNYIYIQIRNYLLSGLLRT